MEAFQNITLTVIVHGGQRLRHLTPLTGLQQRILELLSLWPQVYTRLLDESGELIPQNRRNVSTQIGAVKMAAEKYKKRMFQLILADQELEREKEALCQELDVFNASLERLAADRADGEDTASHTAAIIERANYLLSVSRDLTERSDQGLSEVMLAFLQYISSLDNSSK